MVLTNAKYIGKFICVSYNIGMLLSPLSEYLVDELDKKAEANYDRKLSVNPVVSEVATLYEKFRNAMDYREDDVLLRAAIERILKRRLLLGGTGEGIAKPLVRELLWARYFPDSTVPETIVAKIEKNINLYLALQQKINEKHKITKTMVNTWIIQLMSSEAARILNPNKEKELISNFMYQLYRDKVIITDDTEQTKDVQVFIATRRTFAKEDQPLLRFHLFLQLFGELNEDKLDQIAEDFIEGHREIDAQLNYKLKDKIFTFIKNQTIPFFILEDVFKKHKGGIKSLVLNQNEFNLVVLDSCSKQYKTIKAKVRTATVRGVIFIFVTKAILALSVEGTYESFVYGKVLWGSIALNTMIPPFLMVIVGALIKTPGRENSLKILERIQAILYSNQEYQLASVTLRKTPLKINPFLNAIFILLWLLAIIISVGAIVFVLDHLGFNKVSEGVFIFFLAIVSFISYRINQTAHMYTVSDGKQNLKSVFVDFFFMPIIHLGRNLTENISRLNLFLFLFDYIIEAPFKGIFAFFEEWFLYLRTQREKLG